MPGFRVFWVQIFGFGGISPHSWVLVAGCSHRRGLVHPPLAMLGDRGC